MVVITDHETFGKFLIEGEALDEETGHLLDGDPDYLISIVETPPPGEEENPPPCGWEFWNLLPPEMRLRLVFDDIQEDNLSLLRTAPTKHHVDQMIQFARMARSDNMMVHCAAGHSRSPAVAIVWLVVRGHSPKDAVQQVKNSRPGIVPHLKFLAFADEALGLGGSLLSERISSFNG